MRHHAVAAFVALATPGLAAECRDVSHDDNVFSVCEVAPAQEDLRLFLTHPETGGILGSFENVETMLAEHGQRLDFAMNAGMYHDDRTPVGHYAEAGETVTPVIRSAGPGNFGLLPNGVFCIGRTRANVYETERFLRESPACRDATQSGPMLVIDGELHPRFLPDSDSRYRRNGVGTSANGKSVWFVISRAPVTFHEFATFFRDVLNTPQALYLDGNISRLYAPEFGRNDGGLPMGPIVGVVADAPAD